MARQRTRSIVWAVPFIVTLIVSLGAGACVGAGVGAGASVGAGSLSAGASVAAGVSLCAGAALSAAPQPARAAVMARAVSPASKRIRFIPFSSCMAKAAVRKRRPTLI